MNESIMNFTLIIKTFQIMNEAFHNMNEAFHNMDESYTNLSLVYEIVQKFKNETSSKNNVAWMVMFYSGLIVSIFIQLVLSFILISALLDESQQMKKNINEFTFWLEYLTVIFSGLILSKMYNQFTVFGVLSAIVAINVNGYKAICKVGLNLYFKDSDQDVPLEAE